MDTIINNERLVGLLAFLQVHHGGEFVNNAIRRDELLSILAELRELRAARDTKNP